MLFKSLPKTTKVNKVVPKNAFDEYTNTKAKKNFTEFIKRITWTNKLSKETINLEAKEIEEIQFFKIELKQKADIQKILDIINKTIPYPIIFWIEFSNEAYLSTASKHPHPTNDNLSVVDWNFNSKWFNALECPFQLNLKTTLDETLKDIYLQISDREDFRKKTVNQLIENQQKVKTLKNEINKLKTQITKTKQFNQKVELNLQLKEKENELNKLLY